MYREVTVLEVKEVLRLWLRGQPRRRIARKCGVARNTVRRYIGAAVRCGLSAQASEAVLTEERLAEILVRLKERPARGRGEGWERCEAQRAFIEKHLAAGVRLTKLRKLLLRNGVEISYATLYRFAVEELGFGRAATTIPVADCAPGEEVQLDTGWMGYLEPDLFGKRRRFQAWIFTAVRSRHRFVYPCFRETTETAIEACEAAWTFFGGIFRVLLPDNTKVIVQTADPLDPRINPAFLEYAQARSFEVDPTRVRSPRDKGRVERAVPSTREDCFGGEHLHTIDEARAHAARWCLEDYGLHRHTRTQRLPLEAFETEERASLMPAPSAPYEIPIWCDPKVHRDQHVQVAKALYSLPLEWEGVRLVGKTLRARADRSLVRLYLGNVLVKVHPRQPPGGRSTDPADFPPEKAAYANRDIAFLKGQASRHGANVGRFAQTLLEGPLPWTRMRRVYALLGLCKRYGSERVNTSCAVALEADMLNVRRLERMIQLASSSTSGAPTAKIIPLGRYLRPTSQYALPFAPGRPNPEENGHDH